jgi:rhodanese-related sulfurtransferase
VTLSRFLSSPVAEAIARNAIIWDVRSADAYVKGHIAGAISIGNATKVLRDENTEDATERIEKLFGAAGLDPKREIIVMAVVVVRLLILALTSYSISAAIMFVSIMMESRTGPLRDDRSVVLFRSNRSNRSRFRAGSHRRSWPTLAAAQASCPYMPAGSPLLHRQDVPFRAR